MERGACSVCGADDAEAHHADYAAPLDVIWLCPKHHAEQHRKVRESVASTREGVTDAPA